MMQCEHCHFENTEKNLYCKRCGAPLPVFIPYHPSIEDYISSPLMRQGYYPFMYHRRSKKKALRLFRTAFYFSVALPITVFGLISTFSIIGSDTTVACAAFITTLGVVAGSTMTYRRVRNRESHLHWGSFLLCVMGITSVAFLAFCGEIAFIPDATSKPMGIALTCGIITIYGFMLEGVALW